MRRALVTTPAAGALLGALLCVACGTGSDPAPAAGGFSPRALGACSTRAEIDGPDAYEFASMPGAWVRVEAVDLATVRARETGDVTGRYVVVGGDAPMTKPLGAAPTALRMHGTTATAAAEALAAGATVHAHTGAIGDPRHVAYAFAVKGAEVAFLGDCQYRLLTQPITHRLAPDPAARLTELVGATAPRLRRALQVPPSQPPPT